MAASAASSTYEHTASAKDASDFSQLNTAERALLQAHKQLKEAKSLCAPRTAVKRPREASSGEPAAAAASTASAASASSSSNVLASIMSAVDAGAAQTSALAGASAVGSQFLEQTNDPMLFHMELLGKEGWNPADGKHLVVSVTGGFSSLEGNTLTARCTVKRLPGVKRTYAAVNLLGEGQAVDSRCEAHVALWQYTTKTDMDQFYVLGYRSGDWNTGTVKFKPGASPPGPVTFDKPFWLRLVIAEGHMLLYLDGRLVKAHPLSPETTLKNGAPVSVMLPPTADYGEPSTMSVSGMWWGFSHPDAAGKAAIAGRGAAAPPRRSLKAAAPVDPKRVHVARLPADTTEEALRTHLAPFEPETVNILAGKGFAFVTFATAEQAQRAIRMAPTMPLCGQALTIQISRPR